MLYWMCAKGNRPPTGPQLQHAIKRNFGGLEDFDTYDIFKRYLPNIEQVPTNVSEQVSNRFVIYCSNCLLFGFHFFLFSCLSSLYFQDREILSPDCSPLGLIRKSLQTKETSWHGYIRITCIFMYMYMNIVA